MDMLKLLTRGGSISREYFIHGRKFFHAAAVSNGALRKSYRYHHSCQSPPPPSMAKSFLAPLSSCVRKQPLIATNQPACYSTDAPQKEKNEDVSSSSVVQDSASGNESERVKNLDETGASTSPPETEGDSSTDKMVSKSQTGEPLPSEKDQSDWDSKIDKLYKQIDLEVLAYEPSILDSYQWFVLTAATHLGIKVGKCWSPLKSNKLRFPLLKSAFVHKKHQVQYEVRTYHRFITLHKMTSSTADTFLEYIERNLPEGVGLKVTRIEAKALPQYLQEAQQ